MAAITPVSSRKSPAEHRTHAVHAGQPAPLGATMAPGGVNFSVFSRDAEAIDLLLFDHADDATPSKVVPLSPLVNRTYHYWHVQVPGLKAGQLYAYRAKGQSEPGRGVFFDPHKALLDPYGRGVVSPAAFSRAAAAGPGNNAASAMKSVVVDPTTYDWEGDEPLRRPASRTIIYEMHVRGFTANPNSGVAAQKRGTYAGLIEKIPYLVDLGVSAVELLPVFQFDPQDCPPGPGRVNYWGYAPVSFFAPHQAYASRRDPLGAVDEFRDMVKALHKAGIEVILDVVYNHTAEGGAGGPVYSFRGLDNPIYYILDEHHQHANYSGCGNTLNANNPVVRRLILDSLRYWVREMHVDGFRFDLASILSRDNKGRPLPNPPVLWDIESDPTLAGTKLIAEAWDAAGLYQVGSFVGDSWREWNGRFRDDCRSFFRGDPGALKRFADRIIGSPEMYSHKRREAEQSVNFVTCHDGFTLNDLVSYNGKHNQDNGEENRDGSDDNLSWNCGAEGPTSDAAIEKLRGQQVRNFLAVTMLSLGVPMILMGDEVRRTQNGNNNAYGHDGPLSWFDWSLVKTHAGLLRFVSLLNERRLLRSTEHEQGRVTLEELLHGAALSWHGTRLGQPDWSEHSRSIALSIELNREKLLMHFILNAHHEDLEFELPQPESGRVWRRWIDTALDSPEDIVPWTQAKESPGLRYLVRAHSVVALIAPLGDLVYGERATRA